MRKLPPRIEWNQPEIVWDRVSDPVMRPERPLRHALVVYANLWAEILPYLQSAANPTTTPLPNTTNV